MVEENARKDDRHETNTEQDMDSGYAWIILFGSCLTFLLGLGSLKSFGVLYTEMLDHFSAGSGTTAWIGSITWFLLHVLAPLANFLSRRYSFRTVSFTGGIMVGCGYLLSGFVTRIELMYLTFMMIVCMFVGGVFALISPLFDTLTFMAVYAGVAAAFPASFLALISVLAIERVGMENFEAAFSIMFVCMSVPSLICQPIAGWMADYYGSWYPAFILTGITLIFAGVILWIEPVVIRYGKTYSFKHVDKEMASPVNCIH